MQCALSLQAAPPSFAEGVTLRLHSAVTCGQTDYIVVGGVQQHWLGTAPSTARRLPSPTPESTVRAPSGTDGSSAVSHSPAGSARAVAGGGRWEFLGAGPAFEQLRTTVSDSKTGHVVCSDELWTSLVAVCDVAGQRVHGDSGNWLVHSCLDRTPQPGESVKERPAVSDDVLLSSFDVVPSVECFLLPALLSRLLPASGLMPPSHWLSENRRVSVLFTSLPNPHNCLPSSVPVADFLPQSLSVAPSRGPAWLPALHMLVRTVQQCVYRVAGQIRQLVVDDKGCVCVAVFGLPPLANEDDAVRAVSAALDIREQVRLLCADMADKVQVGLASGGVWCGPVGSDERCEYAVVGDVVNLAARIMGHSLTGQRKVLCDEETARACNDRVHFDSRVELVQMKGRRQMTRLYEPISKRRISSPPSLSLLLSHRTGFLTPLS